jgi:hypothetical protein
MMRLIVASDDEVVLKHLAALNKASREAAHASRVIFFDRPSAGGLN